MQHAQITNTYKILVRKAAGKRPLGRPGHRWAEYIGMDVRVLGWEGVDWIHLSQDRDQLQAAVNMVMNLLVPQKAGNLTR
jgi:hypothetical protein